MEVIYRKIDSLSKLENNPRTITPEDMERLKESIRNNPDYLEAHPIANNHELRGSSFQVSSVNDRKATKAEYIEALKYEFTLPLPNNRRWDLDKEIIPVFEKI